MALLIDAQPAIVAHAVREGVPGLGIASLALVHGHGSCFELVMVARTLGAADGGLLVATGRATPRLVAFFEARNCALHSERLLGEELRVVAEFGRVHGAVLDEGGYGIGDGLDALGTLREARLFAGTAVVVLFVHSWVRVMG